MFKGAVLAILTFVSSNAVGDPLRLRGDALVQSRSPVGLLVLHGEDRLKPWLDAEAVAWVGAREIGGEQAQSAGDVLTLTVRARDPGGRGEVRVGRFLFSAGAVRPIHVDGVRALGRAPTGTTLEGFAGAPVVPRFGARIYDFAAGGRLGQTVGDGLAFGVSYAMRRSEGQLADQEVGPDFALLATKWLDVAGRLAFDTINPGPTDALGSLGLRVPGRYGGTRVELFGTHRSPARMLPATSLFSVLGDLPSTTGGASVRYRAAPRLDLLATGATMSAGGELGAYGTARATLAMDDDWRGNVGFELRRQSVGDARWSGARGIVVLPVARTMRISTELEIVKPDFARDTPRYLPWALVALWWQPALLGGNWDVMTGVEALGTRDHRRELHAMLRLSYVFERAR